MIAVAIDQLILAWVGIVVGLAAAVVLTAWYLRDRDELDAYHRAQRRRAELARMCEREQR